MIFTNCNNIKIKNFSFSFSIKKEHIIDKSPSHDTFSTVTMKYAGIAQLVERCLAKAKVAGSSPVSRSNLRSQRATVGCRQHIKELLI